MHGSSHTRILRNVVRVCVLATTLSLPATDAFFAPSTVGRVILNPSLGKDLLTQCSRATPSEVSGFWKLSAQDVDELELALPKYLDAREKAGQQTPPKGQAYHRQYVGFTSKSERFIYGNFYPASAATGFWKDKQAKLAFGVCDGGPVFWGIVYRVSSKTFEQIHFNGFA